jgi:hypothetical protein
MSRANKPFTVIPWKKYEEPKQHFKCKIHDCRLLETANGWYCPISCGPTYAAVRKVYTHTHHTTNPSAQFSRTEQ